MTQSVLVPAVPVGVRAVGGRASGGLAALGAARHRLHEIGRFLTVGLASTVLEFTLFNVLILTVGLGPVWAKVVATSVAMGNAYLGNRFWSFRHRPRTGARREAPRFLVVNVVGLALGAAAVGFASRVLGVEGVLALNLVNVVAITIVMVFRFWAYHHWVFPTESRADALGIVDLRCVVPSAPSALSVRSALSATSTPSAPERTLLLAGANQ